MRIALVVVALTVAAAAASAQPAQPSTTPGEALALVALASLVVSEDSGLMHLAWVDRERGKLEASRKGFERAIEVLRDAGDRALEGVALSHLGVALHRSGRIEEARRAHLAALAIHRATGERRMEGAELMPRACRAPDRPTRGA